MDCSMACREFVTVMSTFADVPTEKRALQAGNKHVIFNGSNLILQLQHDNVKNVCACAIERILQRLVAAAEMLV
jgi:hypothetical protein